MEFNYWTSNMTTVVCNKCGKRRNGFSYNVTCECGGIFSIQPEFKFRSEHIWENFPYLKRINSLGECETPLISFDKMSMKLEYFSPTYSYKDRGSRTLISWLSQNLDQGSVIKEDSSGNAGASIAAYGNAAGFETHIFVPEHAVREKLEQIEAYGAHIHKIPGSREDVTRAAQEYEGYFASHVLNPEFRDGMRMISYELFKQIGRTRIPTIYVPLSAGTLFLGIVSGFEHLYSSGEIESVPRFVVVQPEYVSPICSAINNIKQAETDFKDSIADALVSRKPALAEMIIQKIKEHGSLCVSVSEDQIINARKKLALMGILVEYSSATVLAAYEKLGHSEEALLIMTGNGLKNL